MQAVQRAFRRSSASPNLPSPEQRRPNELRPPHSLHTVTCSRKTLKISKICASFSSLYFYKRVQRARTRARCLLCFALFQSGEFLVQNLVNILIKMNSETSFVFSTFNEFYKCWRSGANSCLFIESVHGKAFINFSAFLGNPDDVHLKPWQSKRNPSMVQRKKSAKKIKCDNDRAVQFQESKRD